MKISHFTDISSITKINRVIQFLTYSDILMLSGWGLISPFLTVFFADNIPDGSIAAAGFATTLFFLVKSVFQIPIAQYLDRGKGEKDDYWVMVVGSFLISAAAFFLYFATSMTHVYLIQILYGIGAAMAYPSWNAIFSRHLDKNKEAIEWSFYDTAVGVGVALSASLGGLLIENYDYQTLFLVVAVISTIGTLFLLGVKSYLMK